MAKTDYRALYDRRTHINGETAIKPYYYVRNGLLHVRYMVDRCIELSRAEEERVHSDITRSPALKQDILAKEWDFQSELVGKAVIHDGIEEMDKRLREWTGNGGR
jgi:hypothetical protein